MKVSIVALELVDKQDLSRAEPPSGQEQDAIRAVAGGAGTKHCGTGREKPRTACSRCSGTGRRSSGSHGLAGAPRRKASERMSGARRSRSVC